MPTNDSILTVVDSTLVDAVAAEVLNPWEAVVSRQTDAPTAQGAEVSTSRGVAPYMHGLVPEPRAVLPGYDSNVMTLLLAVFLFMSVNFRSFGTYLKTYTPDLFKERRRDSFYDNHTLSETRVLLSLLLLAMVSEGILVFSMMSYKGLVAAGELFSTLLVAIGCAMAYYVAQLLAYNYVGFVFADPDRTRQWVRVFNGTQSLLGIGLVVPALVVLFNPGVSAELFAVGVAIYLVARIIFICKGFRLFYDKMGSLLYFILYLCALEFIPLYLVFRMIVDKG